MKHKHHKFWMVYCPQRTAPTYQHLSRQDAEQEARRLATMNPGTQFFVLRAVSGVTATQPEIETIKLRPVIGCEIPF